MVAAAGVFVCGGWLVGLGVFVVVSDPSHGGHHVGFVAAFGDDVEPVVGVDHRVEAAAESDRAQAERGEAERDQTEGRS